MFRIRKTEITIIRGDIAAVTADAIVNAANEGLRGGGGVDGAIHRAGGPAIMAECRRIGHCHTGSAVLTTAGNLKARFVIHTVGPVYSGGPEDPVLLASCYRTSLAAAESQQVKSIAFPSISTGVYGYPVERAVSVVFDAVAAYIESGTLIELIIFVLFSDGDYSIYMKAAERRFGTSGVQ